MISEVTRARMSASARMRRKRDQGPAEHARNIFTQVMLNGKELRHCTFAEVATFGERYARLASMGEPVQVVGQVLSQKQVRAALFG
jgi:hypothetical protein